MIYIDEKLSELDLEAALRDISPQRREQALRFRHEQGRRECVAAYLLLKRGLREEFGIDENPVFEYGEHGKPLIVGHPDIHFNLSHCRDAAACAIDRRPVGIDIESVGRYTESVARYAMNDREMDLILAAEQPDVVFTRLWTMKEARQKLTGEGISNNIKDLLVQDDHIKYTTVERLERGYVYTIAEFLT